VFASLPPAVVNAPLFWHGKAERYANVSSRFAHLTAELARAHPAFRRFRFHDLRHLHAVEWLRSGRSIYDLQKRLGHASIKTTEVYLAFLTPDEERLVKNGAAEWNEKGNTNPAPANEIVEK
jgi:integrase/recombinase XerD